MKSKGPFNLSSIIHLIEHLPRNYPIIVYIVVITLKSKFISVVTEG